MLRRNVWAKVAAAFLAPLQCRRRVVLVFALLSLAALALTGLPTLDPTLADLLGTRAPNQTAVWDARRPSAEPPLAAAADTAQPPSASSGAEEAVATGSSTHSDALTAARERPGEDLAAKPSPVAEAPAASEPDAAATSLPGSEIHVCFCSDDADLRPLVVAINSTLAHARQPERVFFHVVTSAEQAGRVASSLAAALPAARVTVHHNAALQSRIQELVHYRKSSGARRALSSPFNFAPFYLESFLGLPAAGEAGSGTSPSRLIYLDTDVVLLGDVGELQALDLQGNAAAAVEDCSQRFEIYIDFKELKRLGLDSGINPKACVFNRGIFVMDVARWRELDITPSIERWMVRYREGKKDLYKFGMSQPPWLLALRKDYFRLGPEWNCRGLGRAEFNSKEYAHLKASGFNQAAFKQLGVTYQDARGRPYVATCAAAARMLHFNGPLKPWRPPEQMQAKKPAWCLRPGGTPPSATERKAGGKVFLQCADLWRAQMSPLAAAALAAPGPP